jgi:hypothetical protein
LSSSIISQFPYSYCSVGRLDQPAGIARRMFRP